MVVGEFTQETDLLIIGGGPGGYSAAFKAAQHGIQTTVVESNARLGGVCLHRGCIPSKTLLHVAEVLSTAEHAKQFGVSFGKAKIDLNGVRKWRDDVIGKLANGLDAQCKKFGVERVSGTARFEDSKHVAVSGGEVPRIRFRRCIIATGSKSIRLRGIEADSPRVLHSREALRLDDVPDSMLVIGGGYIGLELGTVYAALGSKVTVVEMMDTILPGVDADLVRPLARRLQSVVEEISLKTRVTGMKEVGKGIEVSLEGDAPPKRKTYAKVLIAVGRRPNTDGLDLDKTKAALDDKGFVAVDEQFRTADPKIFAIGDVIGNPMLAHKAVHEGRACAEMLAGKDVAYDPRAIPAVVFTDPEIAWCGLTETEAKRDGVEFAVRKVPWGASGRATAIGRVEGVTKLIFDPATQRILGMGMTGPHAGEMIAEGVLALEMGAVATDLDATIHPHPTLSETVGDVADLILQAAVGR